MFVLFLLFIGWGSTSFAQNVELPVTTSIKSMLEDAKNSKYKSVEDFLTSLPESMKSNFIFMGESQSLQKASKEFPRVILTSVNGDVRVTFNTDPKTQGYNKVEVSYWDNSKKKFEYQEVEFDLANKKSKVHGNQACINCHGNPSKPNWDTYNYWAGAVPFNKDGLVMDTKELSWYLELLKKTDPKSGDSRLKILKPVDSAVTIKSMVEKRGFYLRKYLDDQGNVTDQGDLGGLGNVLFSSLLSKQGEAVTKRLRENENFESIKYLLAGLFIGCEDMSEFSPDWYESAANNYFKSTFKDKNLDKNYVKTLKRVSDNTLKDKACSVT